MKLMHVSIQGRQHEWGFIFAGDPAHLADWHADGLDVALVVNTVPAWLPAWAVRGWVAAQDIINFKWGK